MFNQLKRSLSLIFGLILCINSVWLLNQDQRHFGIMLSIIIAVALILYALLFSSIQRWKQNSRLRTLFWNSLWGGFLLWMISVAIFSLISRCRSTRIFLHNRLQRFWY